LLGAGITTFVSLIGEYDFKGYRERMYPATLPILQSDQKAQNTGGSEESGEVTFIHFPIGDFQVADKNALHHFVDELKKRLLNGHVVFIHCLGGHGRTGMVVIPLLCALYQAEGTRMSEFANSATLQHRYTDRGGYFHLPETKEQEHTVALVEPLVRKKTR
jgi:hypothetical protein